MLFRKSRGTEASPTVVLTNDFIGSANAQAWDGSSYVTTGFFGFKVDGAVTTGSVPTALTIYTGSSVGAGRAERMVISSSGIVTIKNLVATYTNGSAYVCVNNSGQIYASETACP